MWILAGWGTAAPRCIPTWSELAKGEPPVSREPVAVTRQGGGSAAGGRVWPCRAAAGAEPPLHWERGQGGQAGTCTGLEGGATSQGFGETWSSPWSIRLGKNSTEEKSMSPGKVAPTSLTSCMAMQLCGLGYFFQPISL